jgi:hypothetical protein
MITATCCTTGTEAAEVLELEVGEGDGEVEVREVPQPNSRKKTTRRLTSGVSREKRIVTMIFCDAELHACAATGITNCAAAESEGNSSRSPASNRGTRDRRLLPTPES